MITETPNRRILVIDDNETIHNDFHKVLEPQLPEVSRLGMASAALLGTAVTTFHSPHFDVTSAMQGEKGVEMLQNALTSGKPFAMAFVDMRMPPGIDGVETVRRLWQIDPELHVVICTAHSDHSWNDIINELGASDHLLVLKKPFDPVEVCQLATALSEKHRLQRQSLLKVVELEHMVHERTLDLRRQAETDKLTGLPNRAGLQELLNSAIALKKSGGKDFALYFIDFDRFKLINDSLGHRAGDLLLKGIADRLRALLGPMDDLAKVPVVAARLGGDEFVVLQRDISAAENPEQLAHRLMGAINDTYRLGDHDVHCTASMGIATSVDSSLRADDILRDADNAMYSAKAQGKARYVFFTPQMHREALAKLNLEGDLRQAIAAEQFELHYQPIVSLTDASLLGFEALIRWRHPDRGIISPLDFIPIAEETGLILPIGQWVIRESTRQLRAWIDNIPGARNLTISVNCSRKQLADCHLITGLFEALASARLDPHRLNLEITESTVMENPTEMRALLARIKAMGIHLHMDDFGTGYSSLNCLHSLPLNVLKIDRSFIQNVSERRDYASIIDAIIVLAHNLDMRVIAEGVETAEHTAMLAALDCDEAQGYFFSKPIPAEKAAHYITTHAR